jgi:hypothetical protein
MMQGRENRRAGRRPPGTFRADVASVFLVAAGVAVLAVLIARRSFGGS